jgi:heme-degrading monooxygenase HmoA
MIVEKAEFTVPTGREEEFELALAKAREVISASHGFLGLRVGRGVERPSTYLLLIEWATLADHLEGFRESEAFATWRSLVGPFFAQPPLVEHFEDRASFTLPAAH